MVHHKVSMWLDKFCPTDYVVPAVSRDGAGGGYAEDTHAPVPARDGSSAHRREGDDSLVGDLVPASSDIPEDRSSGSRANSIPIER